MELVQGRIVRPNQLAVVPCPADRVVKAEHNFGHSGPRRCLRFEIRLDHVGRAGAAHFEDQAAIEPLALPGWTYMDAFADIDIDASARCCLKQAEFAEIWFRWILPLDTHYVIPGSSIPYTHLHRNGRLKAHDIPTRRHQAILHTP
jgi:hypothetical protein